MGWKLLSRPRTQLATKELAQFFVDMEPAPHDRPLSERRLQVYRRMLALGQFRPVAWASALCEETNGIYRVNGKHTSILLAGLEVVPEFFVTIEEYGCDTLEDVAKLYATFDSTIQSRSSRDIYYSFAAAIPELRGLNTKVLTTGITGVAFHLMGVEAYSRSQPVERAELVIEHSDFVLWLNSLIVAGPVAENTRGHSRHKCQHLLRQPVVAAMFATYQKDQAAALAFWEAVRDDSGPKPDCPDRVLSRYLLTTVMQGGLDRSTKSAGPREIYVKCLHAWNAWRKGDSTRLRYSADLGIPVVR